MRSKEAKKAYDAKRYWDNPEKARARSRIWARSNPGRVKATNTAWRKANAEYLKAKDAARYTEFPERAKAYRRKRKYGLDPQDFEALLLKQNGLCGICGIKPEGRFIHIDHCHATDKIRGVLCNGCNVGLGNFKDSPDFLRKAADYIEAHR